MNRSLCNIAAACVIALGLCACKYAPTPGCCGETIPIVTYITGTVTDATTGEPLSGVTVEVGGAPGERVYSDVTDTTGNYRVHNSGNTIDALLRGYGTYSASISKAMNMTNITYNISMTPGSAADTTPPPSPRSRMIVTELDSITWNAPSDVTDVAGYMVYQNNAALRATAYLNTEYQEAPVGTPVCYSVSAFDASGNESPPGGETCFTSLSCGGGEPQDVDLTVVSAGEIRLDWDSYGQWEYNIYRDGVVIKNLTSGENSTRIMNNYYEEFYSDTSFSPDTKYCYSVTEVKNGVESLPCQEACITSWP